MSLALIEESAKEVRRLAIAGSPLAVGDFRLKKLVAPLEQAGAKVPVFAQVAKAISELVNGKEAESASRLLNLSTLLNAILYTQGQSGADGECREFELFATKCASTKTTARVLKPVIYALISSGSGRFETIKSAHERGVFNDLRLIDPAIKALGDNFGELADLMAEKVLPNYGPGVVPCLKSNFDLKGKKHDARKLEVMHRLDSAGTLDLCKTALDDGSVEVKEAAIACLGKHEDCLPLVLEQTKSKNKQLRAAALEALAEHDRPEVTSLFTELIQGKALDILVGPFRALRNRDVVKSLLGEGKNVFEQILKGDSEQIARFWDILNCLDQRKDPEVEEFLLGCLANSDKLAKVKAAKNQTVAGADLMARLAAPLYRIGSPQTLEAVLAKRDVLPIAAFNYVILSALRVWPPNKFFDEFSSLLGQKKGAPKAKNEILQNTISVASEGGVVDVDEYYDPAMDQASTEAIKKVELDERWLDAAVKADELSLVCTLARPGHKAALDYLLKALAEKKQPDADSVIEALMRCKYQKVTDLFLEQVQRLTKKTVSYNYEYHSLLRIAGSLPREDLPKLDAFAAKLDEKYVDQFLEAIAPLRPTAQPTQTT